ncbi:Uma2 family endonuclease [soil metagenome]
METTQSVDKITVETFRSMYFDDTDDFYYELLEGEMIKKSAPAPIHQAVSRNLMYEIETYNRQKTLGIVLCAPIDVLLDKYNQFQPDLIFITGERKSLITKDGIKGAPDLVIEIISPSSVMRDRIEKKRIYQRSGVKEYWLVSPEYEEIEVFVLKDNVYDLFSAATKTEGKLESIVLKDMQLDLKQIFLSGIE